MYMSDYTYANFNKSDNGDLLDRFMHNRNYYNQNSIR